MTAPDKEVEVIQVIRTYLTLRGDGTEVNPLRHVTQYWTFDGELLAEVDPSDKASESQS